MTIDNVDMNSTDNNAKITVNKKKDDEKENEKRRKVPFDGLVNRPSARENPLCK